MPKAADVPLSPQLCFYSVNTECKKFIAQQECVIFVASGFGSGNNRWIPRNGAMKLKCYILRELLGKKAG